MGSGLSIGYLNSTVWLMLLTGGFILLYDVFQYEKKGLIAEKKTARFLGWFNVVVGIGIWIGHWLFRQLLPF